MSTRNRRMTFLAVAAILNVRAAGTFPDRLAQLS